MTIYGWDLSHYDGPDSRKGIDQGFSFFTHKAGGDANDAELGSWWNMMKGYRGSVLLGAYWVQYPGNPAGRADAFLARLDSQCPGWRDGPFILQVDCEIWGGDRGTMPGKADIKAFCDQLRVRCPKLVPIVYAPKWCYGDTLTGLGYPLWASSYVAGSGAASVLYPGDSSSKWAAYSGQVPAVLQFTSSAVIAGQTTCDANAYRGTLDQLTALVAPGWKDDEAMAFIADQGDFNAAMLAALKNADVRKAHADATFNTDGVMASPPGSVNNDGTPNTHFTAYSFLYQSLMNSRTARDALAAILTGVQAENAEAPASAPEIAQAFLSALNSQSPADTAAALIAVLGADKAAEIGAILSGSRPKSMARHELPDDDAAAQMVREATQQRIEGSGE